MSNGGAHAPIWSAWETSQRMAVHCSLWAVQHGAEGRCPLGLCGEVPSARPPPTLRGPALASVTATPTPRLAPPNPPLAGVQDENSSRGRMVQHYLRSADAVWLVSARCHAARPCAALHARAPCCRPSPALVRACTAHSTWKAKGCASSGCFSTLMVLQACVWGRQFGGGRAPHRGQGMAT